MQVKFDSVTCSPSRINIRGVCPLNNFSLELAGPGIIGIMGGRLSVSRTLLYLLAGVVRPERGHIFINGEDIHRRKYKNSGDMLRCVLVTADSGKLLYDKSAAKDVEAALSKLVFSPEEIQAAVSSVFERVGLDAEKAGNVPAARLTRADRFKLSLACAVAENPDVLLLEDPFTQMDTEGRAKLPLLLKQLAADGCLVIVTTNDVDFLAEHVGRVLVLDKDRIIRDDCPKTIFLDYFDLIRNGIPVPAVKMTVQKLRERDVNMPSNVVEYEQFIDRLRILMWRKQR